MAAINKRGSKWRVQIRRKGMRKPLTRSFTSEGDARIWATAKERELDLQDTVPVRPEGTVGDLLSRYTKAVYPTKQWAYTKQFELDQLKKEIGHLPVEDLTKKVVIEYGMELRARLAPSGVGTRMSYLRTALRTMRNLYGEGVPLEQVDAAIEVLRDEDIIQRSDERERVPTANELAVITAFNRQQKKTDIDLGGILEVLSVLPFRISELLNIRWDDLVPEERAVWVRGRKHPKKNINPALRKKGVKVALPVIAGVDIYELIEKRDRDRFPDRPFPWDQKEVSNNFYQCSRGVGIADLHLHDCRAGAISFLLANDVNIPVVAKLSGHKNWKVLQRVYDRMQAEQVHDAIARTSAAARPKPRLRVVR